MQINRKMETRRLGDLARDLKEGKYVTSGEEVEFQRDYAWKPIDEFDLIESVLRGRPIGSIITWRRDIKISSIEGVIDGQQRGGVITKFLLGYPDVLFYRNPKYQSKLNDLYRELDITEGQAKRIVENTSVSVETIQCGDREAEECFIAAQKGRALNTADKLKARVSASWFPYLKQLSNSEEAQTLFRSKKKSPSSLFDSMATYIISVGLEKPRKDITRDIRHLEEYLNKIPIEKYASICESVIQTFKILIKIKASAGPLPVNTIIDLTFPLRDCLNMSNYVLFEEKRKEFFASLTEPERKELTSRRMGLTMAEKINSFHASVRKVLVTSTTDSRRFFNEVQKSIAFDRQKGRCGDCNSSLESGKYEADHIIPYTAGGKTEIDNEVLLCFHCHDKKHGFVLVGDFQ